MFTNLLIVVAAGLLAPLALGFFPRVRLPAIVLEIVLGIVIGPSGLGWVKPDAPVSILALVGLAFLLFLSGLEIDAERLRGRIVKLTALGFAVSFAIAILIGIALHAGGFVKSPLFVAIVLVATSLGVIFPVLKDSGNIDSSLGELVIAAASIADFGSIILLSLFFSGKSSTSTAGRLILLGIFGLVVVAVGVAIASAESSMSLSRVLRSLQDTTAQIRVRAAFLLLIGFTALAESVGLETILGAFAAGALLSLLDRDEMTTHPQFRLKLEAIGFGVFIPIFFVTSGLTFDLSALFASTSTIARVPLFLLAILLARGLPALVYLRLLGLSRTLIAGILQATSLPFIVHPQLSGDNHDRLHLIHLLGMPGEEGPSHATANSKAVTPDGAHLRSGTADHQGTGPAVRPQTAPVPGAGLTQTLILPAFTRQSVPIIRHCR